MLKWSTMFFSLLVGTQLRSLTMAQSSLVVGSSFRARRNSRRQGQPSLFRQEPCGLYHHDASGQDDGRARRRRTQTR